jgi:hypothetical protein
VANDRVCPELVQQLTLAILDHAVEEGLRMVKTIRFYLDILEGFLKDSQKLVDHLRATTHKLGPVCLDAGMAHFNRRYWEAHGSELATFLDAHPSRREDRCLLAGRHRRSCCWSWPTSGQERKKGP